VNSVDVGCLRWINAEHVNYVHIVVLVVRLMRSSLDWDKISVGECMARLGLLKRIFPEKRIEYRRSPSWNGYHVVVYDACDTWKKSIEYRKKFWDDPMRIQIDEERHKSGICANVLCDTKGTQFAGRWIRI